MLACSIRCFEHLVVSNRSGLLPIFLSESYHVLFFWRSGFPPPKKNHQQKITLKQHLASTTVHQGGWGQRTDLETSPRQDGAQNLIDQLQAQVEARRGKISLGRSLVGGNFYHIPSVFDVFFFGVLGIFMDFFCLGGLVLKSPVEEITVFFWPPKSGDI